MSETKKSNLDNKITDMPVVKNTPLCQYTETFLKVKLKVPPSMELKRINISYPCSDMNNFISQMNSNLGNGKPGHDTTGQRHDSNK